MENQKSDTVAASPLQKIVSTPREPKVGEYVRGVGTLIAVQEVPPPPPPKPETDYIFEEIGATTEIRLNGNMLTSGASYTDFYGKGTSVETAIEEARDYADRNGITADSDIEVVAIKKVEQARKRSTNKKCFYAKEFLNYEHISRGYDHDLPEKSEEIIWSSKTG